MINLSYNSNTDSLFIVFKFKVTYFTITNPFFNLKHFLILFFKFYFIYFIGYAIPLIQHFPPLSPALSTPHSLRQSSHLVPVRASGVGSLAAPFPILYFISPQLFCNCRFVLLFPSPLHALSHTPFSSGNHQDALHIHDSVSVLLVCIVYVLDSIVERYVFFAIVLFIALIFFFFLNNPFNISHNNSLVMMNSFSFYHVWEALYLPSKSKRYSCRVEQSWLEILLLMTEYFLTISSSLQSFF